MANAQTVEGLALSGKIRKKTSVFWSTVPENDQFNNVQVPGVAMGGIKDARKHSQTQKFAQVVQKSKSDSAILGTRTDPLTVNKPGKSSQGIASKQNDFPGKKEEVSSLLKGATSCDQLANMSSLSESSNPRRASLKNLNVEDKKRVANLIKELAKTGEERELALERLQEERVSFEEQLGAIQEEQTALKQERESLKQRLEMSEKLLQKYESELKDVKSEKREQERIFKKRLQAKPMGTQTSPSVETLSKDIIAKSRKDGMNKTHGYAGDDRNPRHGRMQWGAPQIPVYSNSLFDVKVSDIEKEQSSESQSANGEYQWSGISENSGLHELYLREYSLQLRLQEQQIEIQRQQVQLQQQLQLLQQQQQVQVLPSQGHEQHSQQPPQQHAAKQESEEYKYPCKKADQDRQLQHQWEISRGSHLQQQNSQDRTMHSSQHGQNAGQKQSPLNQPQYGGSPKLHQQEPQNNETLTKHSPTQQTNLLQKRASESRGQHIEENHGAGTVPHNHSDSLSRLERNKHDRRVHVMENSRHKNEAVLYKHSDSQAKDTSYRGDSPPSHNHYHHLGHDGGTNSSVGEYDTDRNKGTDTRYYHSKHRHGTKRKSSRKHSKTNNVNQVDFNNNELFQPKSQSPKLPGNHLHDRNGNIVQDHPQVYVSDSYSETDDQTDMEHQCRSHRPCHCVHYHTQTRQDQLTSDYDHPVSKHVHYRSIPQHDLSKTSPHIIEQNPYHKDEPHPVEMNYHPNVHQHSPNRTSSYHQKSIQYTNHAVVPPLHVGHHHDCEYLHHNRGTCDEHSSDAVIYQASQTTNSQHEPEERRVHVHRPLDSPRNTRPALSGNAQTGTGESDNLPFGGLERQRTRINQDESKGLLDDYIHNHQTTGQHNAKSDPDYPRKKVNKNPTTKKMSRLKKVENDDGFPLPNYAASRQATYKEEDPSYSLYRPSIRKTTLKQSGHPIGSYYSQERHRKSGDKSYPDSLVEILEDLEVHAGYEGYSEEARDTYSTDEREYDSDEEESSILDNIFFLKR